MNPAIETFTDKELVADAKMYALALSNVNTELKRRGIEAWFTAYDEYTRIEVEYERVTREKIT